MKKLIPVMLMAVCFGCTKNSDDNPGSGSGSGSGGDNSAAVGYWFGSFTIDGATTPTAPEGHLFKKDGTMVSYDFYGAASTDTATCPIKGYGTYTVSGSTVKQTYSYGSAGSFTATLTIKDNIMSGPYTGSQGGTLTLTKQ